MKMKPMLFLASLAASLGGPVAAANCAPREVVVAQLAERYGESRQSMGLGTQGAVMEVFASEQTGTWTITVATAQGMTCLVASGQAFEALAEALPKPGNDA